MKRLVLAICLLVGFAAGPASAADLCVGGWGCFATLQAAVAAAQTATRFSRRGTFAGGVTIDKSVALVGAGANSTIIAGGGPVLTIFREPDARAAHRLDPGRHDHRRRQRPRARPEVTFGGGIWIPTSQLPVPPFNGTGATVAIADSVITGNTVTSRSAIPPVPFCGPLPCGFNTGGGIDNGGVLTLTNTRITNNTAGSTSSLGTLASGISAGGIDEPLRVDARAAAQRRERKPRGRAQLRTGSSPARAVSAAQVRSRSRTAWSATTARRSLGRPSGFDEDLVALAGGIRSPSAVASLPRRL